MLDYARFSSLLGSHRYREAVAEARYLQSVDPNDIGPAQCLGEALLALGDYADALPILSRVDSIERSDPRVSGRSGQRIWMACAQWILGNQADATRLMSEMVDGILDGSIEFGDAAGGVQQGLLLYYMGISASNEVTISKALSYLRSRVVRRAIELFPGPVARYYLDETDFADVLAAASRGKARNVSAAVEVARNDLLSRRWLCVALFHDGVKARAQGDESHFRKRMRECFSLENPLLEPEWYLARHEVERSTISAGEFGSKS